jgi:hypothetical protein
VRPPLKPGDRVCCYGQNIGGNFDVINEEGDTGTVLEIMEGGSVTVRMDNDYGEGRVCEFHPKQVRRLVPKKRREWWLVFQGRNRSGPFDDIAEARILAADWNKYQRYGDSEIVHVTESKRESGGKEK